MNVNEMTLEQFRALPSEPLESGEVVTFRTLIILPTTEIHDSGYLCMDFVFEGEGDHLRRISAWSDALHLDGIGGYGYGWLARGPGVPTEVPVSAWTMDCLATSGLVRLWPFHTTAMVVRGWQGSSFEVYAAHDIGKEQKLDV